MPLSSESFTRIATLDGFMPMVDAMLCAIGVF